MPARYVQVAKALFGGSSLISDEKGNVSVSPKAAEKSTRKLINIFQLGPDLKIMNHTNSLSIMMLLSEQIRTW